MSLALGTLPPGRGSRPVVVRGASVDSAASHRKGGAGPASSFLDTSARQRVRTLAAGKAFAQRGMKSLHRARVTSTRSACQVEPAWRHHRIPLVTRRRFLSFRDRPGSRHINSGRLPNRIRLFHVRWSRTADEFSGCRLHVLVAHRGSPMFLSGNDCSQAAVKSLREVSARKCTQMNEKVPSPMM
jgi:hypothetical protein